MFQRVIAAVRPPLVRFSHISGNQVRPGVAIELEGKLYRVIKSQSVKPGKGVAYMQAELRDIISGTKINRRFRASESVKKAPLTKDQPFQFLYQDGDKLVLMQPETFEQIEVSTELLNETQMLVLDEGLMVTLQIVEGLPLWMNMPQVVSLTVESIVAVGGGNKEATFANGKTIQVPGNIEVGDTIKVSSETGLFVEKV
ncbi:elongation factor P [Thraustotheca clavata]|uniref:Elongation factor P n=1 Tax=Thraustotheca clavata TaxID=74557 RepID=A0A1V9Z261_9STRA|nr:elongation factor P [Thraustotheca clavata]